MVATVRHRYRFGVSFGLVIDTARADGIDVSPVFLALWMLDRLAVDLAGGRQNETGPRARGKTQGILSAPTPDRECL